MSGWHCSHSMGCRYVLWPMTPCVVPTVALGGGMFEHCGIAEDF